MKVLHTVKYYAPSKGGMESVVKNIINGINYIDEKCVFTVYSNHHYKNKRQQISNENFNVIIKEKTPFLFKSQPLNIIYPNLKQLIIKNDIIHHHYPFPNLELALLRNINNLKNKKLVITWHANIKNSRWRWTEAYYNPLISKLLDRADSVVVTSPQLFNVSDILDRYENKIKIIPLSFDPLFEKSPAVFRRYPYNKKFNLLFVGKLRKYKGIEYLIKAIAHLNVTLTIVGDGEEEMSLKKLVEQMNIIDSVFFLKNIDNNKLSEIYNSADLFVLPSINEAEAFGVVQLEAMASGLPVINTNLNSGVPFVSLNNITGLTVEPQNVNALKEAIEIIKSNPCLYETFSKNSLERSQIFRRKEMAAAYLDVYKV
jgi:glycosyltransferase involved in cell wall biosynthesis